MASDPRARFGTGFDSRPMAVAVAISTVAHLLLFSALVLMPEFASHEKKVFPVITVNMVTLPPASPTDSGSDAAAEKPPTETPDPAPLKVPAPSKAIPVVKPKTPVRTPEKARSKVKRSLKKKTFKPDNVVKKAIDRIEKEVEKSSPTPLENAFAKLRKTVEGQTPPKPAEKSGSSAASRKGPPAPPGGQGAQDGRVMALIDIYRVNIAMQIQQNWAFSSQLVGKSKELQASLVFKVYPSGEIKDIFFTDHSGNRYLDESAYKAIVKSNPVDPHPPGVLAPYVQVGLRFTPEGIN